MSIKYKIASVVTLPRKEDIMTQPGESIGDDICGFCGLIILDLDKKEGNAFRIRDTDTNGLLCGNGPNDGKKGRRIISDQAGYNVH